MSKNIILIVEDERIVAEDIKQTLETFEYKVSSIVSSGEAAIKKAEEDNPDLILMDIVLKGKINGIEAAKGIWSRSNIPVVYLTAYADEKILARARETQPYGYVIKPFTDKELHSSIQMALCKSQVDRKIERLNALLRTIRRVNQFIVKEKDRDRLIQGVCDILVETRGYDVAWIGLLDGFGKFVSHAGRGLGEDFLFILDLLKSGKLPECGQKALSQAEVVEISSDSECKDCSSLDKHTEGRMLSVQLRYNSKINGVLGLHIPKRIPVDNDEKLLVNEVAGDIAFALNNVELEKEKKQVEETLRESEEQYRSLFNGVPIGLCRSTPEGQILAANPALVQMLGYPDRDSIMAVNAADIYVDSEKRKIWKDLLEDQDVVHDFEFQIQRHDGETIWVKEHARIARDVDGTVLYYEGSLEDISETKRAHEALKESEERYKSLVESTDDPIYLVSRDLDYLFSNQKYLSRIGISHQEEIIGKKYSDFHSSEACADFIKRIEEVFRRNKSIVYNYKSSRDNRHFLRTLSPVFIKESGEITAVTIISKDITDLFRAVEELRESHDQLRRLSAHLQVIREEERTNIAREIHDELGQQLTALKISLSWLRNRMSEKQKTILNKIDFMSHNINETIESVKRISSELRPLVLDDLGLFAAIKWQANSFQKNTGIQCDVSLDYDEIPLDKDRSITLFRIYQEALTNVMRHADATKVNVKLTPKNGDLIMTIEDNGKGISKDQISKTNSLGLIGMRERLFPWKGQLTIEGQRGKGTTVRISIPLKE